MEQSNGRGENELDSCFSQPHPRRIANVVPGASPQCQTNRKAVATPNRSSVVPELPTFDEAGLPGYELATWGGYTLPARAPHDRVLRLNAEINKTLVSPSLAKSIAERGGTVIGGTPEQFVDHMNRETAKWAKVIKAAGITPQ